MAELASLPLCDVSAVLAGAGVEGTVVELGVAESLRGVTPEASLVDDASLDRGEEAQGQDGGGGSETHVG